MTDSNDANQAHLEFPKKAEAKLEQMHRQLADASRMAGMAEVAASVLPNVGNVLNSEGNRGHAAEPWPNHRC